MTEEEWKKKNNFREVGNCYLCKHHIFNDDWTYSCRKLNESVKKKVIIASGNIQINYIVCDKYEGW